jgi:hypothetical protein
MLDSAVSSSPGLVLDKRMAQFTPEGFKPSTVNLTFPDYYVAVSKILAKVPKADMQAAMVLETIMGLASYVDPDALESKSTQLRVRHTTPALRCLTSTTRAVRISGEQTLARKHCRLGRAEYRVRGVEDAGGGAGVARGAGGV